MRITTRLTVARKWVPDLRGLRFPKDVFIKLDSGLVLYCISKSDMVCWPYFPIGPNRRIVKRLKTKNYRVPDGVKVIVEMNPHGEVWSHMDDCFGHVLLYLRSPRAKNGCRQAMKEINSVRADLGLLPLR